MTQQYLLSSGVRLTPVKDLPPSQPLGIGADESCVVLWHTRSRRPAQVIDAELAQLVEAFRRATSIPQAVVTFSQTRELNPREVLRQCFPLLKKLVAAGWIVAEDDARRESMASAFLRAGESILGYEVIRAVQLTEDTEVYQGRSEDGRLVAIKLCQDANRLSVVDALRYEAEVLKCIQGDSRRLLCFEQGPFGTALVLGWLPGVSSWHWFATRLTRMPEKRLKDVTHAVRSIVRAYLALHEAGVVHGDVHPGNLLLEDDGYCHIVDFGSAFCVNFADKSPQRQTIPYFDEPEFVLARQLGKRRTAATLSGEQYSIAAVLFYLITGHHYIDFSLEKDVQRLQILESAPRSFASVGVPSWPALEACLFRALSKEPEGRFKSTAEFADQIALALDCLPEESCEVSFLSRPNGCELSMLKRVCSEYPLATRLPAPTASLSYGAAGIAFGLLRASELLDDAYYLSYADAWAEAAVANVSNENAFVAPSLGLTKEIASTASVFHGEAGAYLVRAIVSDALGDIVTFRTACERFIHSVEAAPPSMDLSFGIPGALIGVWSLLRRAPEATELYRCGSRLAARIDAHLVFDGDNSSNIEGMKHLGMAHGWCGVLFARLLWSDFESTHCSEFLARRISQLASFVHRQGSRLMWPRLRQSTSGKMEFLPSWCNGAAGFALLLSLAVRHRLDSSYELLVEQAIHSALDSASEMSDLCCGRAGRGLAVIQANSISIVDGAQVKAAKLIEGAMSNPNFGSFSELSLLKGKLGVQIAHLACNSPRIPSADLFYCFP
ncbi:MAG: phosphotransferase [Planctomycetaceae bacterium]|nr:phosphotransferase [Planctomycetaceae bacterium]